MLKSKSLAPPCPLSGVCSFPNDPTGFITISVKLAPSLLVPTPKDPPVSCFANILQMQKEVSFSAEGGHFQCTWVPTPDSHRQSAELLRDGGAS